MQIAVTQALPYLIVNGAKAAIDFYCRAFGAQVDFSLTDPADGRIGHCELRFGPSRIFLADEYPDFGAVGPARLGGSPVKMHLDVNDVDAFVAHAVNEGASVLRPATVEFFGYKKALLADPFGCEWNVASKVEDVSPAEMQRRWRDMAQGS